MLLQLSLKVSLLLPFSNTCVNIRILPINENLHVCIEQPFESSNGILVFIFCISEILSPGMSVNLVGHAGCLGKVRK